MKNWWPFWLLTLIGVPLLLVGYQNCAPAILSGSGGGGGGGPGPIVPAGQFALLNQTLQTGFNQPLNWNATYQGDATGWTLSLDPANIVNTQAISNIGTITITNPTTWSLSFQPQFGYRGQFSFWLFAFKNGTMQSQAQITITVGNSFNLLKPALAVRGSGCVMCHAEIHSNIVTDFGYNDPFYFGNLVPSGFKWNDGTPYGDHDALLTYPGNIVGDGAWARLKIKNGSVTNHGLKVFVPQGASIPTGAGSPAALTGASTLKGYLQHRLNNAWYNSTKFLTIEEKSQIYIGAPTESRLLTAFNWQPSDAAKGWKFFPEDHTAWPLSGLNVGSTPAPNNFYFNNGLLICEGDLLIKGTLLLENATIRTRTGCRIHVTEDIYISGPIQFNTSTPHNYDKRNIQLVAARAILMGLGSLWKNGQHCEQSQGDSGYWGYYDNQSQWTQGMTPAQVADYQASIANSARFRLKYFWGVPAYYRRGVANPLLDNLDIWNRYQTLRPNALDAACEPGVRNVAFQRILLNAPYIHSRYAGGIWGSVIGEFVLMPLGLSSNQSRFRFEFDPVFNHVSVLPLLQDQDFLFVQ